MDYANDTLAMVCGGWFVAVILFMAFLLAVAVLACRK